MAVLKFPVEELTKRRTYIDPHSKFGKYEYLAFLALFGVTAIIVFIYANYVRYKQGLFPLYGTSWFTPKRYRLSESDLEQLRNPPPEEEPEEEDPETKVDWGYHDKNGRFIITFDKSLLDRPSKAYVNDSNQSDPVLINDLKDSKQSEPVQVNDLKDSKDSIIEDTSKPGANPTTVDEEVDIDALNKATIKQLNHGLKKTMLKSEGKLVWGLLPI